MLIRGRARHRSMCVYRSCAYNNNNTIEVLRFYAFEVNAETRVWSDIIFFKKHRGIDLSIECHQYTCNYTAQLLPPNRCLFSFTNTIVGVFRKGNVSTGSPTSTVSLSVGHKPRFPQKTHGEF